MIGVRNLEPGTRNPETGTLKPDARTRKTVSKCLSRLSVFQEAKSRALALAGKLDCPTDPHFIKNIISVRNFS